MNGNPLLPQLKPRSIRTSLASEMLVFQRLDVDKQDGMRRSKTNLDGGAFALREIVDKGPSKAA